MTTDRTFGLSRYEKIRIEAARLAVPFYSAKGWSIASAIEGAAELEAWMLAADADAEKRGEGQKLADERIAAARTDAGGDAESDTISGLGHPSWSTVKIKDCIIVKGDGHFVNTQNPWKWLATHLYARGFNEALTMSRQDLIRAYYTDVNGGTFPNFPRAVVPDFAREGEWPPVGDTLAIDEESNVMRWAHAEGWILIDELPGHRIENGKIMWSPGLWPPPESEAGV